MDGGVMYRVEDKYICSERDMLILQSRVKTIMNPDKFSVNGSYKVTSIYFDDYTDRCLKDADDGVAFRKKYRIRIYNNIADVIKLEVKYKAYNRVYKKSKSISLIDAKCLISGQCIYDDDMTMDSPVTLFNMAIKNDLLKPKVVVEYDRCAYVFASGNVRITFDRNIRFSRDIDKFLDGNCSYAMIEGLNKVLEIKYDDFLPGFIAQMLESGNMIQTAYSKYKLSREQMEGEIYVS